MKHLLLLLSAFALLLLMGNCDSVDSNNTEKESRNTSGDLVSISTEKAEYGLKTDGQAEITIKNNSDESIFITRDSHRPYSSYFGIQRQQRDESWEYVDASRWFTGERSLLSREIKPGQTFGPDSVLLGPLRFYSGTYRFVYLLCSTSNPCQEYEMLPFTSRISNTWKIADVDLALDISTDKKEYALREEDAGSEITLSLTNNSEETLFIRDSDFISFQLREGSEWETIQKIAIEGDASSDYYKIEPGELLNPQKFSIPGLTSYSGTYRFVYELCPMQQDCREDEMLPLEMRASNTFEIGQSVIEPSVDITTDKTGLNFNGDKSIGVTLVNNLDETIYLKDQEYVGYQRLENGKWITVEEDWFTESRTAGFMEIKPGEKLESDNLPLNRLTGKKGTYRFIYELCGTGPGCSKDELLPVYSRTSNTWQVIESDFQTDVFTDKSEVSLSQDEEIGVGLINNSDNSIFLRGSEYVGYQRFENEQWVTIQEYIYTVDKFPDFFELKPGERHNPSDGDFDSLPLKYLQGGPGVYRFVYLLCPAISESNTNPATNCTEDEMLPLALRVSNTFTVVK